MAYSNRGFSEYLFGLYDQSILDCNEAIRLNPSMPHAHYNRGSAKALSGKVEEALTDFKTFIRLARQENKHAEFVEKAEKEIQRLEDAIRAGKKEAPATSPMPPIPPTGITERKTQPEAVIFLDMVGSSDIMSTHGVDHHLNLYIGLIDKSKEIFKKYDCEYIKGTGDGFMAVAPGAMNAVNAMVELMKWRDQRNKADIPIYKYSVRIGVGYGQTSRVESEGSDRFGERVVFAARLESLKLNKENPEVEESKFPKEDRIFVSRTVQKQVSDTFTCIEIGAFELKGLEGTHTVWYVDWTK